VESAATEPLPPSLAASAEAMRAEPQFFQDEKGQLLFVFVTGQQMREQ
jgi:hypothetical protein